MKTKKKLVWVVILLVGVTALTGCIFKDEANIKPVIEKYYDAFIQEDINLLASTLDDNFVIDDVNKTDYLLLSSLAFAFVDIKDIKIVYDSFTIIGDVAIVSCSITTEMSAMGENQIESSKAEFILSKASGNWLITTIN